VAVASSAVGVVISVVAVAVELQPITEDNVADVYGLQVKPGQEAFVAPNPWSLAQASGSASVRPGSWTTTRSWPGSCSSDNCHCLARLRNVTDS
jgi:hypothetical protein